MKTIPYLFVLLVLSVTYNKTDAQRKDAQASNVTLKGEIGEAERLAVQRMFQVPFTSLSWIRADLTKETVSKEDDNWSSKWNRPFKHYSGDISGRYLELMSVLSGKNKDSNPELRQFIKELPGLQQPDGHFGWATINWNDTIDFTAAIPKMMPALWGNGRMLCGLVEAYKAFGDHELLQATRNLGDFYIATADQFMDAKKMKEYKSGGTSGASYVTCYFNAMEGLAKLFQATKEQKYLALAERMAAFYDHFDVLPIMPVRHTHGMLCNQYALLLLYEQTRKKEYLKRVEDRWNAMMDNGYVDPAGGVLEGVQIGNQRDEGCAEADWLRLNLKLSDITGNKRYLDMAERLLCNHYLANQNSSGGFGHRFMLSDKEGLFGFADYWAEATWCCDFHGTLGFQLLKPFLAIGHGQEIRLNFPLSFQASLNFNENTWDIQSSIESGKTEGIILQQTIELHSKAKKQTRLALRLPDWSKGFTATDAVGKIIEFEPGSVYWRSKKPIRSSEIIKVYYKGNIIIENRNCQPMEISGKEGDMGKVVLRYGPKLLSLKEYNHIPVLFLDINANGKVILADEKFKSQILLAQTTNIQPVVLQPREVRDDSTKSVFVFDAIIREFKRSK